jgi:hypothetical protein
MPQAGQSHGIDSGGAGIGVGAVVGVAVGVALGLVRACGSDRGSTVVAPDVACPDATRAVASAAPAVPAAIFFKVEAGMFMVLLVCAAFSPCRSRCKAGA